MERRKHNRISIDQLFDVSVSLPQQTSDIALNLIDISKTGLRFEIPLDFYEPRIGEEFTLRVHINSTLYFRLAATVMNLDGEKCGVIFSDANAPRHLNGLSCLISLLEAFNEIDEADPYLI